MGSRRRLVAVAGLVAVMVVLGGCGSQVAGTPQAGAHPAITDVSPGPAASDAPTSDAPATETPTDSSTPLEQTSTATEETSSVPPTKTLLPDPPKDRKYNQYGDVLAKPGVSYGLTKTVDGQDRWAFVFRVNSIRVDKGCGKSGGLENTAKPENKHFVVIDLDVELRELTPAEADEAAVDFTSSSWEAFDAKDNPQTGIHTDAAVDCLGDDSIGSVNDFAEGALNSGLAVVDVDAATGTVLLKTAGLDNGWEFTYG